MATTTSKSRGKKRSKAAELRARVEAMGPSAAELLELAKRFPAPQEWYDQADQESLRKKPRAKANTKRKK
jgi:hypothetical protein